MASHYRRQGAARLGLATLALALQLAGPLASTSMAQSAPAIAATTTMSGPCTDPGPVDYPVAGGWFYTEEARGQCIVGAGPDRNRGYLVVDDDKGAFWTEFRRFGGVDVLGYPVSMPYHYPANSQGGYWYQAFERGILQYQPENGRAVMANAFDMFTEQGLDDNLQVLGIPTPRTTDKSSLGTEIDTRMSWLTEPQFLARYFFNPVASYSSDPSLVGQTAVSTQDQAMAFFGLPESMPERMSLLGPDRQSLYPLTHAFMAQRFQKVGLQMFFEDSKERFQAPVWSDPRVLQFDPTIVPGDGKKGCVALTAVGLLARSIGSDTMIPSSAIQPRPLAPSSRASVETFVPPVDQGQLMTSFQIQGTDFGATEPLTISMVDARLSSTNAALPTVTTHVDSTLKDGSFDAVVSARVGVYQLTVSGDTTHKTYVAMLDLSQPSGIYVTDSGTGGCKPVGLPVG